MRLKSVDGPLSIHNGNSNDILNSPKRINTLQNSNVTNFTSNLTTTTEYEDITGLTQRDNETLNNINSTQEKVQWCNPSQRTKKRELTNNANNRNQLLNINNTLAASLRTTRLGTASSIYSESSPDDSLLDFEDVHQSVSSADTSPQDEDRGFDISDSDSSEESNLSNRGTATLQRRGIVNPNYPGFQHLAHTLDYSIKASSDTDFTDDDFECESLNTAKTDVNNINNNNVEDTDYPIDHIDSVNRLDSVENIQKVFYDKPVFNIQEECGNRSDSETSGNSNQTSDEDTEISVAQKLELNIKTEENLTPIIGDFGKEVEQEFGRISLENLEQAVVQELDDTIEKLNDAINTQLSPIKYNIQPNFAEPKLEPQPLVLNDTKTVKLTNMPLLTEARQSEPVIMKTKICDAFLSNAQEAIASNLFEKDLDYARKDSNRELEEIEYQIKKLKSDNKHLLDEPEKFNKEDITKDYKEKDDDSAVPRKKEKIDYYVKKRKDYNQQFGSLITFPRRECGARNRDVLNRRSVPMAREKKRTSPEVLGGFDVYNIETAMPKIDLEAIESHLRAAREEERRRRTDREEIRRRLAMGSEDDYYTDRPGRKPSLQARLQSGMNLQICFMNETVSDTESPNSDNECPLTNPKQPKTCPKTSPEKTLPPARPATLSLGQPLLQPVTQPMTETDFFARQARLQTEARMALAQAKEMARMQMEIERQRQKKSPITEMVRNSLEKVGIPFPEEKRRLSRQILTEMNVAQLQVIVNDLHTQIETLNESLVKFLMDRDDLHMEQDSMLVDIEDLTRYLGAKEQVFKEQTLAPSNNNIPPPSPAPSSPLAALNSSVKPHLHRIASLVKK
ncbi:schwannomin-interacting protein 1 homolog [Tribolium castaneum]|uniref:schwannomin-interacting protein 1 homolog n=1 Tax=Tribolium castaneum TaxID=7070 RepID=UPI00077DBB9E|nr:PREDICTED: probable WRKY transcription factor protein 1 isoform X2 [Tribolium castaneum]XP_015835687.1 PREDICTED: probable WRKY transcription factor protein 1 isoform X2 [Tribolium castaneum]XP_015835688.1 PREDICTED: probable WRKY transcription factor protein 1 isoform X2 [Tribolium castaneum]|eukprot:XP_015835686.1 PREDICTED: probable WRKY transcription factor protein 1 isoform X2 [Tribolium castaneum]